MLFTVAAATEATAAAAAVFPATDATAAAMAVSAGAASGGAAIYPSDYFDGDVCLSCQVRLISQHSGQVYGAVSLVLSIQAWSLVPFHLSSAFRPSLWCHITCP